MNEHAIWTLSEEDFEEITNLYEKKLALENLAKILGSTNQELYNKVIADYGKTMREFSDWWRTNSMKYNWEGNNWRVDFINKQIMLVGE